MPLIQDILGHGKQRGQLLSDIASDNVTHAYLFAGPAHVGKLTVARWFGAELVTDGLKPSEKAHAKSEVERLIHPDYLCLDDLWIEGVNEDWKLIGASSNVPQQHRSKAPAAKTDVISIEDIRLLSERLHETGTSPHRACIIRGIERMQPAAANAFLKILEEPPSRVVFILTTDNLHAVLPTVQSRTRVLRFSPLSQKEMAPLLEGQPDDDAAFALHIAGGAPGLLIRLLDEPEQLRMHRQLHAQARQFWQATHIKDRLAWLLPAAEKKQQDIHAVLLHLGLTLREQPDAKQRALWAKPYGALIETLKTNAHRGLLLERFALEIDRSAC